VKRLIAALAAGAALLAAASPAQARTFEFGLEDEGLLLAPQNAFLARQTSVDWHAIGVDVVRIHARWWEIAPAQTSATKPSGFNAADPDDPQYDWSKLDNAVSTVRDAGITVMLSITGPGPLWTSGSPSKHEPRYKPKPSEYASFARAVATRYKNQVDRYLLWNEPNQKGWLQPQWQKQGRSWIPVSPHIYRDLVRAGQPAVAAADRGAEVVIGELAPVGNRPISSLTPMEPLPFLRSMGCVDDRYKSIRTGLCKRFKAAKGTTLGYHPHPLKRAPDAVNKDTDQAQFGDLKRLFTAIDKLRAHKRISVGKNIHLTEFGYETNPPDPASGVSQTLQTRYLQQAAYIAWATKRVLGLSFYQWFDEPTSNLGSGTKRYSGWQTGLISNTGTPKPALSVMPAPFVIDQKPGAKSGLLWGQVRADSQGQVVIERRTRGSSDFKEIARVNPASDGVWTRRVTLTANAAYRYRWTPRPSLAQPMPTDRFSGIIDLNKREKSRYKASIAPNP
jgi:hypothetical protein